MPIRFEQGPDGREFALFAPRQWPRVLNAMPVGQRKLPLVLVFHGGNQQIANAVDRIQFHLVSTNQYEGAPNQDVPGADTFFVCYLGGLSFFEEDTGGWNAGAIALPTQVQAPDDVAFTAAVVSRVTQMLRTAYLALGGQNEPVVDSARVFLCGFSAGGSMVYRLLGASSDYAAGAVFAGQVGGKMMADAPAAVVQNAANDVKLYHWHGRNDVDVKPGLNAAGALTSAQIGARNESQASRDRLLSLGLTSAQADWAVREDLSAATGVSSFVQAHGLTFGTPPVPLPGNPAWNPWVRYEWGSPAKVRVDIALGASHVFPRTPHHGAAMAWSFFKQP